MNTEYRQALNQLEIARGNYNETLSEFEDAAYIALRTAEDRVMAIIKERKEGQYEKI